MRKPRVRPPASISAFSLSRTLPPLRLPRSATDAASRPRPQVAMPGRSLASLGMRRSAPPPKPLPVTMADIVRCSRCAHSEEKHSIRYVCDKYPHPDPLKICGCERETLDEICPSCGHKGRSHKPRHRCRSAGCHCWAFQA